MSGPRRVKSMDFSQSEVRPVLGPAGNKARSLELRKHTGKPDSEKLQKSEDVDESNWKKTSATMQSPVTLTDHLALKLVNGRAASILRQQKPNLSLTASCSSDASTDSSHSPSTGRISGRRGTPTPTMTMRRKRQCSPKAWNAQMSFDGESKDMDLAKKRCAWVSSNTDSLYAAFHDEEWGVPVHDDKKLFELLSFSTALAELTWPAILNKRDIFREVFLDFDPIAVSKLNEKKVATPGTLASSLLSELKLRAIIENARQICKIIDDLGSFDKYIWSFVNYKPIIYNFRYPRQVPIKTSKADAISKDLVRRGFRGVGPTVVYSFMQAAGITNDHLISCFRYQDCIAAGDLRNEDDGLKTMNECKTVEEITEMELGRAIDDLDLTT
ncbi:DNA-3-methyladenine glycosylase I [Olea europaea subsp. europaea]|uniref:DNA-3-methyladenine glycosylase I n=1 Tax=Olea europaea subsp. europaea TaxID=158383 RepID=A0A8S0TKM7_OLEEU|nr:DNA-3-methyladenine glycosylase I [Olea europaea subsp. europaea]